ncbi:MAG: DUF6586 family protein [Pseudomonadota bacterium]|nr:DUF6586 family protein [Pseudomonadota bacterium]
MAKHKLGLSNQKRYFARFYLEAIENTQQDESVINRKALLVAHQQSCLFHLLGAYRAFIWEVANTYDEVYDGHQSLDAFLTRVRAGDKSIPELEQVYALEATTDSWLNRMLALWMRVNEVNPDAISKPKEAVNLNAIEVRVFDAVDEFAQLHDWYDNLSSVIEEIRQLLGEW